MQGIIDAGAVSFIMADDRERIRQLANENARLICENAELTRRLHQALGRVAAYQKKTLAAQCGGGVSHEPIPMP